MSRTRHPATTPTTTPTTTPSPTSAPPRRAWRTLDLVTTVMIGVAFGVAFVGWGLLTNLFDPVFAVLKPLQGLIYGFFWVPAVVAALVVRRPGAALLAEVIAASVEPLLGGQWGVTTLGSGLLQGLGVELGFLIFAYRRWTVVPAAIGGALAGLLEAPYEWRLYYREWTAGYAGLYAAALMVSGAVLGGVLGRLITRALAATGALAPFPAGREHLESRRS